MERLKPENEDPRKTVPLFVSPSIDDLLKSRDEVMKEMIYWQRNEASLMTKINNPYFSGFANLFSTNREMHARIYVPQLRHVPAMDETQDLKSDEITLYDGINILKVNLPIAYIFERGNKERIRDGKIPVKFEQLKESAWRADTIIGATYSLKDRYSLIDIYNADLTARETVYEKEREFSLAPSPKLTPA